jgi:hypothetical protein
MVGKITESEEIDLLIKHNRDLIEALKNLNEKLCGEQTGLQNQDPDFTEEKYLSDKIPVE